VVFGIMTETADCVVQRDDPSHGDSETFTDHVLHTTP
jgi:hypothetical protein